MNETLKEIIGALIKVPISLAVAVIYIKTIAGFIKGMHPIILAISASFVLYSAMFIVIAILMLPKNIFKEMKKTKGGKR